MSENSGTGVDQREQQDPADGQRATFEEVDARRRSPGRRVQGLLHTQPTLGPALVLVLAAVGFTFVAPNFLDPANFSLVVQQVMIVGTLGIGQTLIILTAGIDLSVGAIMVLSSVVMAKLAVEVGVPAPLALLSGVVVGAFCGMANGLLVTRLRLPPFITTLGTLSIFFALNLYYSGSTTILSLPDSLLFMGRAFEVFGTRINYGTVLMVLMFAAAWYALQWTAWGKHVYAVGDDLEAARLSGIQVRRVLLSVYVAAGTTYGIAAWLLLGRIGSASPQAGQTENLDTITAVVIGGTSLFGGRGSVFGTLVGALIVGVFRNGLSLAGVDDLWQDFTVGALVLVAVGIDQWIRRG